MPHRVAVQIKMWSGEVDWTRPLEQIKQAHESYDGITAGVILSTAESMSENFKQRRDELAKQVRIPFRVLLRRDVVKLFLAELPGLLGGAENER